MKKILLLLFELPVDLIGYIRRKNEEKWGINPFEKKKAPVTAMFF